MDVAQQIEDDRKFIKSTSSVAFLRDKILGGHSRILDELQNSNLRQKIADHFGIHTSSVVIVGSAKLGYSISPEKPLRPFADNSDIDVAIVDNRLFEEYWLKLCRAKDTVIDWPDLKATQKYIFRGWIRPDHLPLIDLRNSWFDFFAELQRLEVAGPYPVRGGLYFSMDFLEHYQRAGVAKCFEGVS